MIRAFLIRPAYHCQGIFDGPVFVRAPSRRSFQLRAATTAGAIILVESPAKAKKIQSFVGPQYKVIASYGHVRDLPPRTGSVSPENGFEMRWELLPGAQDRMDAIAANVKASKQLILATDPDREGEAISWHIQQELQRRQALGGVTLTRMTFTEVTHAAVQSALGLQRSISQPLVDAYLARRALDYLVGFYLSPLLWRKLPGARSAGRVQSVALRLVCEREAAIEAFVPEEYWTIKAVMETEDGSSFEAQLVQADGKALAKEPLRTGQLAKDIAARLRAAQLEVASTSDKQTERQPLPPFTTSTLQQDASSKLGFSPSQTMQLAQQLYEGLDDAQGEGLITYMRTDGVQIGKEAVEEIRQAVEQSFGKDFLPATPKAYRNKSKNAQEAHEAIRPTRPQLRPEQLPPTADSRIRRLYELIWRRTLASQMASASIRQVGVNISSKQGDLVLRASSSEVSFAGFLAVYTAWHFRSAAFAESTDEEDDEGAIRADPLLSTLQKGDSVDSSDVQPSQHFTKPPGRYSEASLVKALEERGIGRPSTYASIIKLLQQRGYVVKENKALKVESLGRVLSAFLEQYFRDYVDYDYTSTMEKLLDSVCDGGLDWKELLVEFWGPFQERISSTSDVGMREVIDALDAALGPHLFPTQAGQSGASARECPQCQGRLGLKLSRVGGFIGCSNYPSCSYVRPLAVHDSVPEATLALRGDGQSLGQDPSTGEDIFLKEGRYGLYVERGDARAGIPKSVPLDEIDLHTAVDLLQWPKVLGEHPDDNEPVCVRVGSYGPYVSHGKLNARLPEGADPHAVSLKEALDLLSTRSARSTRSPELKRGRQKKAAVKRTVATAPTAKSSSKKSEVAAKTKRPLNCYQLFCQRTRKELKVSEPELPPTEVMKRLAEVWKALSEEDRARYTDEAKAAAMKNE